MSPYYPQDYYAHGVSTGLSTPGTIEQLRSLRARAAWRSVQRRGWHSRVTRLIGRPAFIGWLSRVRIRSDAAILDVGCGRGDLVVRLADLGFPRVHGVDPFIAGDKRLTAAAAVFRGDITRAPAPRYDLIIFNHTLEHMADQHHALRQASQRLAADGAIIVRLPLADSFAFDVYRDSWFQFDAPRHLYLHTRASLGILASDTCLRIADVVYDSTLLQFLGSESYKFNRPLPRQNPLTLAVKAKLHPRYRRWARLEVGLNQVGRGDQALFLLRRQASVGLCEAAG